MIFYLIAIGMLCLYKLEIKTKSNYYSDYMSIEKSTAIKGIFILLVFSRHCIPYATFKGYLDIPFIRIDKYLSQLIVTMFLFYSGYGIFESIRKKGKEYVNDIPIKRFLQTLINFDLAIILFFIVGKLLGKKYGIKKVLLSF